MKKLKETAAMKIGFFNTMIKHHAQIPIAMIKEDLSGEVKELIKIWEEKYDE